MGSPLFGFRHCWCPCSGSTARRGAYNVEEEKGNGMEPLFGFRHCWCPCSSGAARMVGAYKLADQRPGHKAAGDFFRLTTAYYGAFFSSWGLLLLLRLFIGFT